MKTAEVFMADVLRMAADVFEWKAGQLAGANETARVSRTRNVLATGEAPTNAKRGRKALRKEAKSALVARAIDAVFPSEETITVKAAPAKVRKAKPVVRTRRTGVDVDALELRVIDVLRGATSPLALVDIAKATSLEVNQLRRLMNGAEKRGLVRFEGEKRGRKYTLPEAPSTASQALTRVIRRRPVVASASPAETAANGTVAA